MDKMSKHQYITDDSKLMAEWDWEKNEKLGLFPDKLTSQTRKVAWWRCATCGYEWDAIIANRSNGRGCPVCAHKVVIAGVNDLGTTHPELAKEWDYEKNGNLLPQNVSYGMGKKVGWICPLGHKYSATILHRSSGTNCPTCNSGRQTSFAEQAIYYYVKKIYPNAINRYKEIFDNGMELDIFIPELRYAIEYDGSFWHDQKKIERERRKFEICKAQKIKLIRIKAYEEDYATDIPYYADYTLFLKEDNISELEKLIRDLYFKLSGIRDFRTTPPKRWENAVATVDVERDRYTISNYRYEQKDSFADHYPDLAQEWHPTKNESLTPNMFKSGSTFVAWWKCSACGYEWETSINHRVNGTGCKQCRIAANSGGGNYKARTIYQYTLDGIFVKEWSCISEAARPDIIAITSSEYEIDPPASGLTTIPLFSDI